MFPAVVPQFRDGRGVCAADAEDEGSNSPLRPVRTALPTPPTSDATEGTAYADASA